MEKSGPLCISRNPKDRERGRPSSSTVAPTHAQTMGLDFPFPIEFPSEQSTSGDMVVSTSVLLMLTCFAFHTSIEHGGIIEGLLFLYNTPRCIRECKIAISSLIALAFCL